MTADGSWMPKLPRKSAGMAQTAHTDNSHTHPQTKTRNAWGYDADMVSYCALMRRTVMERAGKE